jgi:hypothetical protein
MMPFPLDESHIIATETKLGVKFPPSFRQRMMRDNGGEVETGDDPWQLYPFLDNSDRKRLARTCNDIVRETQNARGLDTFPADAIAIGANGSGDQLVLFKNSENESALSSIVYWWDHETGRTYKVAKDFSELE